MTVEGIAVKRLGVQHELAALGRGDGRGERDLAAELVGHARFALADAFDLGRVQGIDLGSAPAVILVANLDGEIEQRREAGLQRLIALDPPADVANDAAEPCAQELQLAACAFELMGMAITPDHDRGPLGDPAIALAQDHALALGKRHQLLDRAVHEPGIGGMGDRLGLYGRVHRHTLEVLG